ncbi:hypothetical protein KC361_g82 [Hortaea werneckii]|nr:hypothetical protein KC361_g82 [Hortaea werneckii]
MEHVGASSVAVWTAGYLQMKVKKRTCRPRSACRTACRWCSNRAVEDTMPGSRFPAAVLEHSLYVARNNERLRVDAWKERGSRLSTLHLDLLRYITNRLLLLLQLKASNFDSKCQVSGHS